MGDDRPDCSEEPSDRSFRCESSRPVALVLDDPIAGAAFCPSVLPTCIRLSGRKELAVETTDSVGLPGLSIVESGRMVLIMGLEPDVGTGDSGPLSEEEEPLIVASLRRRSSKGAPSPLETRDLCGGLKSVTVPN